MPLQAPASDLAAYTLAHITLVEGPLHCVVSSVLQTPFTTCHLAVMGFAAVAGMDATAAAMASRKLAPIIIVDFFILFDFKIYSLLS